MKKQLDKYLREACWQGLDKGVFSAVAAAVSLHQDGVWQRTSWCGGKTRLDRSGVQVEPGTLFDLASLTKPLCTTLSVLPLLANGRLDWQDSIERLLPGLDCTGKGDIRLWHLLNHCSGLPAYYPYYKELPAIWSKSRKNWIQQRILAEPLLHEPGEECLYSDLGFLLLGAVIEKQSGQSLDVWYERNIIKPIGLSGNIGFLPLDRTLSRASVQIAATEDCQWRHKVMQGEVHDEHSWLLGGVAGHAGLFATLGGVTSLCECIVDLWQDRAVHPAIPQSVLRQALEHHHSRSDWALGFDRPSPGASSSGRYFSPRAVGHLGFSGTSFWMDPERDILIVLLTNRVHPTRTNEKIRQFRPYFHDHLMQGVISARVEEKE